MNRSIALSLITILSIAPSLTDPAVAQSNGSAIAQASSTQEIERAWGYANKSFVSFVWLRGEDDKAIYSSSLYTEINRDVMNIYNTYTQEPFGKKARCGGLGCDLEKGPLVARLKFKIKENRFVIIEASDKVAFLLDANCRVLSGIVPVLECISYNSPVSKNTPSIFRFVPGS